VTADSVWAFELAHRAAEIAPRLGVPALRFAPGPLPAQAAAPATPGVQPGCEHRRAAARIAAPIGDENLRESVEKAVAFSLARGSARRPV
jgi:hypothetical protein